MNVTEWSRCRICGNDKLDSVADLGVQAISCRYPSGPNDPAPEAPLHLVRCRQCNLGQLTVSLPPEEMYRTGYGYRSGQTDTMKAHLADLGRDALSRLGGWAAGEILVDIGSNDGTFLRYMPETFVRCGFDPVANDHAYPDGVTKIAERFTWTRFQLAYGARRARLVFATAMFYDLDDPVAFLRDVKQILADDGIVVMEFMYLKAMMDGAWDQISHEHVCYHSLSTVQSAAERAGLQVADFSDQEINGGSLRVYLQRPEGPLVVENDRIDDRVVDEWEWNWNDIPTAIEACVEGTRDILAKSNGVGGRTHVIGASQRGNVTLQALWPLFGIECAVERDERKAGLFTPGTMVPIIHESKRTRWAPMNLCLPWQFREEILRRERELGAPEGTRYLFPLPRPEVVTL